MAEPPEIVLASELGGVSGPASMFAGVVDFARLEPPPGSLAGVALVSFLDGARTHWHTHAGEQILYALEGDGFVAYEDRVLGLPAGAVAYIPPGAVHAHGALAAETLRHLAVTLGSTDWPDPPRALEPVPPSALRS